jgi:hypothetical protein
MEKKSNENSCNTIVVNFLSESPCCNVENLEQWATMHKSDLYFVGEPTSLLKTLATDEVLRFSRLHGFLKIDFGIRDHDIRSHKVQVKALIYLVEGFGRSAELFNDDFEELVNDTVCDIRRILEL